MQKIIPLIAALSLPLPLWATTPEQAAQQGQEAMKEFGATLRTALQAAMKDGGPVNAIAVCNTEAPKIAQQMSEKYKLSIHRTSLKPRATPPTAREMVVLEGFAQQKAGGKPVGELVWKEVGEADGQPVLRMMKAIGTDEVCLTCHGSAISPAVAEKIQALYPDDKATGFAQGDIRGAFSVTVPLAAR